MYTPGLQYGLRRACTDRKRENGFKLNEDRFKLDIRKKLFVQKIMMCLNMFLREIVDATFPSIQGWVGLGSEQPYLMESSLPMAGVWNQMIFKVPSNQNNSKIL